MPKPEDDNYPSNTEIFKSKKDKVYFEWTDIKKRLLEDAVLKSKFEYLSKDNRRWKIVGFENRKEYSESIAPSFPTLWKNASPIERELLITLIKSSDLLSMKELQDQGFPKRVIIETANSLLRSDYMQKEDAYERRFILTPIGRKIISDLINQKE